MNTLSIRFTRPLVVFCATVSACWYVTAPTGFCQLPISQTDLPNLSAPLPALNNDQPRVDTDSEQFHGQGEPALLPPMTGQEPEIAPGHEHSLESPSESAIITPPAALPETPTQPPLVPETHHRPRLTPQRPQLGVAGAIVPHWGFRIVEVLPGSAAERMQLEPGDVILNINGHTVCSVAAIVRELNQSVGHYGGQGVIIIDNVRGRNHCGTSRAARFVWLKFRL